MSKTRPQIVLVGFLDTKLPEHEFVRTLLLQADCDVITIDTSLKDLPKPPWVTYNPAAVCTAAGSSLQALRNLSRSDALGVMAAGAKIILHGLHASQRPLDAVFGLGGSTSTSLACEVFRTLPIGIPKLCVSTMAGGDVGVYIGDSDIVLMPSIVDISGYLNAISRRVLTNAANARVGMARGNIDQKSPSAPSVAKETKRIAVSMFGLTTPCVTNACEMLQKTKGEVIYEPVVFHATGSGGRSMERLISEGWFDAVLDITTTELADDLCDGVLSAGPERLTAATRARIPQVVSLGALDMANFGAAHTVPARFAGRTVHVHNAAVTLVRTSCAECAELGAGIARRVRDAGAMARVVVPLRGWSGIDVGGGPFWDPEADAALVAALKAGLEGSGVGVVEVDCHINDDEAARVLISCLLDVIRDSSVVCA